MTMSTDTGASMLSSMGLFTPFVFLPAFARDHGDQTVEASGTLLLRGV